jgi:hypothetical protein
MKYIFLLMDLFFFSACSMTQFPPPPELAVKATNPQIVGKCEQNYVHGNWQFVHSIAFKMANGHGATVIGVTVIDGRVINTGLMGVEGFVLFEAELDAQKKLDVKRALPPFDNQEFAAGLMRDVQAIFRLPSEERPLTTEFSDGTSLCRYFYDKDKMYDLIIKPEGSSTINIYDAEGDRMKMISAASHTVIDGARIPKKIQLSSYGLQGYTLEMELISADKIIQK